MLCKVRGLGRAQPALHGATALHAPLALAPPPHCRYRKQLASPLRQSIQGCQMTWRLASTCCNAVCRLRLSPRYTTTKLPASDRRHTCAKKHSFALIYHKEKYWHFTRMHASSAKAPAKLGSGALCCLVCFLSAYAARCEASGVLSLWYLIPHMTCPW